MNRLPTTKYIPFLDEQYDKTKVRLYNPDPLQKETMNLPEAIIIDVKNRLNTTSMKDLMESKNENSER